MELKELRSAISKAISQGLKYLYLNYRRDFFDEATSVITSGIRYGTFFDPLVKPFLITKFFGIAVILNMLLDTLRSTPYLNIWFKDEDLRAIAEYLIENQREEGGWSYYPHVKSIPPDADDTGWTLLALYKLGYDKHLFAKALNKLKENIMDDKYIATWLVGRSKWHIYSRWLGGIKAPEVTTIGLAALIAFDAIDEKEAEQIIKQVLVGENSCKLVEIEPVWYPTRLFMLFVTSILMSTACSKRGEYENICNLVAGEMLRCIDVVKALDVSNTLERGYRLRVVSEICLLDDRICQDKTINRLIKQDTISIINAQQDDGSFPAEPFHMYIPRDSKRNLLLINHLVKRGSEDIVYYRSRCVTTAITIASLAKTLSIISSSGEG